MSLNKLPQHLQLAVLSHTPLPHCLSHLPPSSHRLALRTHHPSTDTHATLALHHLPVPAIQAALSAVATFTSLRALSLAGLTVPSQPAACIHVIQALQQLTSLNLHDIGLRPPKADALAAVLPTLRQLKRLDLSSNRLTLPIAQPLAPALRQCTELHSLNLWSTLSLSGDDGDGLCLLADAFAVLRRLTSLAVGLYAGGAYGPALEASGCLPAAACEALADSLQKRPGLLDLKIQLASHCAPAADLSAVMFLSCAASLTQLQALHLVVPPYLDQSRMPYVARNFTAALTQLTHCQLDFLAGPTRSHAFTTVDNVATIAGLPRMQQLQHLWLRVPIRNWHDIVIKSCGTLAQVLPKLTHLSHLHLCAAPLDMHGNVLVDPSVASVGAIVHACLRMPQLKVLHVPIAAAHSGGAVPEGIQELFEAVPNTAVQLSVDLYVSEGGSAAWQPAVGAYVPLFPCVRTLTLCCSHADTCVQPLIDRLVELRCIREVIIDSHVDQWSTSRFPALLNALSCLRSLEKLHCSVQSRTHGPDEVDLSEFALNLGRLTNLSNLKFNLGRQSEEFQGEFLCACARLPQLQVLDVGAFAKWRDARCREALMQLSVKELRVRDCGWGQNTRDGKLQVFRSLQHLRVLEYEGHDD